MSFNQGSKLKDFISDIVTMINDAAEWTGGSGSDLFGDKPRISRKTERKVTGFLKTKQEDIIVYADSEQIKPFGLGIGVQPIGTHGNFYSTSSATIEITTNISEERFDQLVSAVKSTLTEPQNIRRAGYVQILLRGFKNLSGEFREGWSGIFDITGESLDQQYTVG